MVPIFIVLSGVWHRDEAPLAVADLLRERGDRFADRGRVMRKIVDHRNPVLSLFTKVALHAGEKLSIAAIASRDHRWRRAAAATGKRVQLIVTPEWGSSGEAERRTPEGHFAIPEIVQPFSEQTASTWPGSPSRAPGPCRLDRSRRGAPSAPRTRWWKLFSTPPDILKMSA